MSLLVTVVGADHSGQVYVSGVASLCVQNSVIDKIDFITWPTTLPVNRKNPLLPPIPSVYLISATQVDPMPFYMTGKLCNLSGFYLKSQVRFINQITLW